MNKKSTIVAMILGMIFSVNAVKVNGVELTVDDSVLEIPCQVSELSKLGKETIGLNTNRILSPGEIADAVIILDDIDASEATEYTRMDTIKVMNTTDQELAVDECTVVAAHSAETEWNGITIGTSYEKVKEQLGEPDEEDICAQAFYNGEEYDEYVVVYAQNAFQYTALYLINNCVTEIDVVDMEQPYEEYTDILLPDVPYEEFMMAEQILMQEKYGVRNASTEEKDITCQVEGIEIGRDMENLDTLLHSGWHLEDDNADEQVEYSGSRFRLYNGSSHWGEVWAAYDENVNTVKDGKVEYMEFLNSQSQDNVDGLYWASFDVNGINENSKIQDIVSTLGEPYEYDTDNLTYISTAQIKYRFWVDAFSGSIRWLNIIFSE